MHDITYLYYSAIFINSHLGIIFRVLGISVEKEFEKKMTCSHKVDSKIYNKWALITTHTCRRSFCTNMYLKGVPVITIMAISGHKTQENFMKYIKADNRKHAEILNMKIATGGYFKDVPYVSLAEQKNKYLTREEAAKELRITPTTLSKWVRAGEIRNWGKGRKMLFKTIDIEKLK